VPSTSPRGSSRRASAGDQPLERDPLAAPHLDDVRVVGRQELERAAPAEAVVEAGEVAEFGRQLRETLRADAAKPVGGRFGPIGVARRDDPGPGPRRFLPEVAAVEQLDRQPGLRQEVRGGEPDDPAADDRYVRVCLHAG
jgi:hypothetical protein